jgi:hypothetical protein
MEVKYISPIDKHGLTYWVTQHLTRRLIAFFQLMRVMKEYRDT